MPHYWLVDPAARTVECVRLADGRYELRATGARTDRVEADGIPGLHIDLATLWLTTTT